MGPRALFAALLIGLTSAHYAGTAHNLFTSVKRDIPLQSARVNGTMPYTMPRWLDVERRGSSLNGDEADCIGRKVHGSFQHSLSLAAFASTFFDAFLRPICGQTDSTAHRVP